MAPRFCPHCGHPARRESKFCGECGSRITARPHGYRARFGRESPRDALGRSLGNYRPFESNTASAYLAGRAHHLGRTLVLLSVGALTIGAACLLVPFPHQFAHPVADVAEPGFDHDVSKVSFPVGAQVSGTYASNVSISVFVIYDGIGNEVYTGSGTSGSFGFTSINPPYYMESACACQSSASVSGNYVSPLL